MKWLDEVLHDLNGGEALTRTREYPGDPDVVSRVLWHREAGVPFSLCAYEAGCSESTARRIVAALEDDLRYATEDGPTDCDSKQTRQRRLRGTEGKQPALR